MGSSLLHFVLEFASRLQLKLPAVVPNAQVPGDDFVVLRRALGCFDRDGNGQVFEQCLHERGKHQVVDARHARHVDADFFVQPVYGVLHLAQYFFELRLQMKSTTAREKVWEYDRR